MTKKLNTLEDLKHESVMLKEGEIAVFPQFNSEERIDCSWAPKFNGQYAVNNSTVSYVVENVLYVTPFTTAAMTVLRKSGFTESMFYVHFSNGDYPKSQQGRWQQLRANARESYEEDFIQDCIKYCDEHRIGTLDDEVLQNCFELPKGGVRVKHIYYEDTYYPIINNTCLDCVAAERIGTFCTNNGKVVFVYRNGKTYVTKGYKILHDLIEAGYREKGLFVPFSNGEQIIDFALAERWDRIK